VCLELIGAGARSVSPGAAQISGQVSSAATPHHEAVEHLKPTAHPVATAPLGSTAHLKPTAHPVATAPLGSTAQPGSLVGIEGLAELGGTMMTTVGRREKPPSAADAIASLYDQHHVALCRLATVLLGDASRAEEVVQEAFLRTYRSWWRVRDHDRAYGYLRVTVVNLCRSQLRRRTVESRANRAKWAEESRQAAAVPVPGSVGVPEQSEGVVGIRQALAGLPARQREIVVLYYFEDLSVATIATALHCSAGTVKSQLAKARHHLFVVMQDDQDPDAASIPGNEPDLQGEGDEVPGA